MSPEVSVIAPGAVIGILGGGQLGRMTALAAARLGYRCHVWTDEGLDAPAAQVAHRVTAAPWTAADALSAFARSVAVVTAEFENVPASLAEALANRVPVRPGPRALATAQDRIVEKRFLNEVGLPTAPWAPVRSDDELTAAWGALGGPAILKTARLGYDGKGQVPVASLEDAAAGWARLGRVPCVLEGVVPFALECSAQIGRGPEGAIAGFDPPANRHRGGILAESRVPSGLPAELEAAALGGALRAAEELGLVGLLTVEYFVTTDGRLLANELAPRPHNSFHWTMDACRIDQFELLVRAICGLPLPRPARHSDALMLNLIGDEVRRWPGLLAEPDLAVHLYGKSEIRAGRKLGHATRLFPRGGLATDG